MIKYILSKLCAFLKILYALTTSTTTSVVNPVNKLDLYLKELELSLVTSTMLPLFTGFSPLLK